MSDSFTEVTSVSWFGRIKRSVGAVVIGLVLIVAMIVLLFWNEGRAVTTARSLAEGASAVVSVQADKADAANEGKLIHVSGPVTTDATPSDADFGISAKGIRLVRSVEMYQWKEESKSETTKKLGGGEETVTTYTYEKTWNDRPIDSSDFKKPDGHANPSMAIRGQTFQVPEAKLGGFDLDEPVLSLMSGEETLAVRGDQADAVRAAFAGSTRVSVVDGRIYLGNNPSTPAVGDYRVSYDLVPVGDASIIGQQSGTKFVAYQTIAGDRLLMVDAGTVPADKMFADAVSVNTMITWLLRVVGLVVLFIGFAMLLSWMGVLADVIPFVGSMVSFGTGLIAFLLAILVGGAVIAIAWFWYRPLLSVAIFGGAALLAFVITYLRKPRAAAPAAPTAAAPRQAPPPPPPPAPAAPPASSSPPGTSSTGKIAW